MTASPGLSALEVGSFFVCCYLVGAPESDTCVIVDPGGDALLIQDALKATQRSPELILLKMIAPFYAISEDPEGIGYSVFYYEENMAPNEYIKLIAVDGVQPTQETIKTGRYPFTSEVYAVVRSESPPNSLAVRLRDWLLTADGQELIAQSGYAPYSN